MPPKNIYRSRKVVSCKYCFYEKNDECRLRVCPYVAERITAKVINYEKLILEFFKGNQPRLFSTRLRKHCRTYRHFSYLSTSHRKLFEQTRDEILSLAVLRQAARQPKCCPRTSAPALYSLAL